MLTLFLVREPSPITQPTKYASSSDSLKGILTLAPLPLLPSLSMQSRYSNSSKLLPLGSMLSINSDSGMLPVLPLLISLSLVLDETELTNFLNLSSNTTYTLLLPDIKRESVILFVNSSACRFASTSIFAGTGTQRPSLRLLASTVFMPSSERT